MTPTKVAFEVCYLDCSGVEYGVRYDATDFHEPIELEHVGKITIPKERLEWLIDALNEIKNVILQESNA